MYEFEITKGLSVSFQRFPYPASGSLSVLPASRGALPLYVSGPARLTVPSPQGEAFWIALLCNSDSAPAEVAVLAYGLSGALVDVLTGHPVGESLIEPTARVTLPPHHFIPGIRRSAGTWWPIARVASAGAPSAVALDFLVRTWSKPDRAPAPLVEPTRHYIPGEESRARRPPHTNVTGAVEDVKLHIVLADEFRFRTVSGLQVPRLSQDSGPGHRRLP